MFLQERLSRFLKCVLRSAAGFRDGGRSLQNGDVFLQEHSPHLPALLLPDPPGARCPRHWARKSIAFLAKCSCRNVSSFCAGWFGEANVKNWKVFLKEHCGKLTFLALN